MAGDAERDLASGMDGHVSKPIDVETLRAKIDRLTNHTPREATQDMTPNIKHSSSDTVDFAELLARVENDRELLLELVSIFKSNFPQQLQGLREAVDAKDAKRVAVIAHTLKGMLSNLSAHQSAAGAAHLEQLAREGEISALPNAFTSLEREAAKLLRELDTSLTEVHK